MEKVQNILLHHDFAGQIRMLAMEDRGMLLTAIYDYELGDAFDEAALPFAVRLVFIRIRDYLDRNRTVYAERCARNTENGKKGGRPKSTAEPEKTEKTERFSEEPKKPKHKTKNKNKTKNKSISPPPEEEAHARECEESCNDSAPQVASLHPHPLGDQERQKLIEKGICEEYLDSRLSRAAEHAAQSGQPIGEVLIAWWSSDRHTPPWNGDVKPLQQAASNALPRPRAKPAVAPSASPDTRALGMPGRSFDADEFFQAALDRTFREMGIPPLSDGEEALPSPS